MKPTLSFIVLFSFFSLRGITQCYFAQNVAGPWRGETVSTVSYSYNNLEAQPNSYSYSDGINTFYVNSFDGDRRYAIVGNVNYTITFSTPVPANEIGILVLDVNASNSGQGGHTPYSATVTVTVTGYGASPANSSDFVLAPGTHDADRLMTYNPATGVFSLTTPATTTLVRQGAAVLGNSGKLVQSITITSSGINGSDLVAYSFFYKNSCPEILPVEIVDFTGFELNNTVQLQWKVAAALIVSHFEIEESRDGIRFEKIGIRSRSDKTGENRYSFGYNTRNIVSGKFFYRVKKVDLDGRFTYSQVVVIDRGAMPNVRYKIYSNPSSNALVFNIDNPISENVEARIVNSMGQPVAIKKYFLQKGSNTFLISEFAALPGGIYFVSVHHQSGNIIKERVVKQ